MIFINSISVFFGDRVLLSSLDLTIHEKEKIGLVGRNGTGKTTLFKLMTGEMAPSEGKIEKANELKIGYLSQVLPEASSNSILIETLSGYPEMLALRHEKEELETLLDSGDPVVILEASGKLAPIYEQLMIMREHEIEIEAQKILLGLGFRLDQFTDPLDTLSGGWQMRVQMAKLLVLSPPLLLLDEPTNHLDIESIIWLENYLRQYSGGYILISHDRDFLNNTVNKIWEIANSDIQVYTGNYDNYRAQREERMTLLEASFKNQQKAIAQKEKTIKRFMAKATKTSMAQSMQKQLDKLDRIEIEEEDLSVFNIRFDRAPRAGDKMLVVKNVSKSYGDLEVLNQVNFELLRNERIAFVGQNGQGKSTLVKILVDSIKADSGKIANGHNLHLAYYAQDQSDHLDGSLTLLETMQANSPENKRTKLRSILGAFLFSGEDVDKKVSVLSGGEKARLALACLMLHPINLLVLDEPTNHLDLLSKEVLKKALKSYDGAMIVVSHDRDFLSNLTKKVIEFRDHKLKEYLGDINYFLEKRAADNMRQVELRDKSVSKKPKEEPKGQELSREERKKILRKISYLERDIDKLEKEKSAIEAAMYEPDFYNLPDHQKQLKRSKDLESEIGHLWVEWEKWSEKSQ